MPEPAPGSTRSKPAVLSLQALAASSEDEPDQVKPLWVLVRHFLDRFFNNELMSSDEEATTRLVQLACVIGLPGFIMALYLYAPYHPPRGTRSYWGQVGDHYFYVLYSMAATGVMTLFAWDFFFPDLLDLLVLSTLPLKPGTILRARILSMLILLAGFLFNANILAPLVLPAATDPPHLFRFLLAHVVSVIASGIFAATLIIAFQGLLLALLGEHGFRTIALWLQGVSVALLMTVLFLYPTTFSKLRFLVESAPGIAYAFPPLWFLGLYQRILEGSAVSPAFADLSRIACYATILTTVLAVVFYPLASVRKTRGLLEGVAPRPKKWRRQPSLGLQSAIVRSPAGRAIWNFIRQTLLGVPRYRIYLVLYGGMGVALLVATVVRISIAKGHVALSFSPQGLHAAVPIVAFWTVSGLRTTFLSPAAQKGTWVFRVIQGKAGQQHLAAARRWVFCWAMALTLAVVAADCAFTPNSGRRWHELTDQCVVAIGLCALLTDALFLNVRSIPFTNAPSTTANLALLLIPYVGFFPVIVLATVSLEPWIEAGTVHLVIAALTVVGIHLWMQSILKRGIAANLARTDFEGDEEQFPLGLGLRY